MREKNRKLLLISLEVLSLAVLIPIIYWSAVRLLLVPIADMLYGRLPTALVILIVLLFDLLCIALIILWPHGKVHARVLLTLLVFTFSAVVITCLVVAEALDKAFQ